MYPIGTDPNLIQISECPELLIGCKKEEEEAWVINIIHGKWNYLYSV